MQRCGWTGEACSCEQFPWKVDNHIPVTCLDNPGPDVVARFGKSIAHYRAKRAGK